jgi:hypothetical protein
MADYRRANFVPLTTNQLSLDALKAKYLNLRFNLPIQTSMIVSEKYVANLPGLADDVYGTIDFWWVIAMFNGIIDPINDMRIGRMINLPRYDDVVSFLNRDFPSTVNTATSNITEI